MVVEKTKVYTKDRKGLRGAKLLNILSKTMCYHQTFIVHLSVWCTRSETTTFYRIMNLKKILLIATLCAPFEEKNFKLIKKTFQND